MKLDDYRTRYFEERKIRKTIKNGKEKLEYVYTGIWCAWGEEGFQPGRRKALYAGLEVLSIFLLILPGTTASSLNAWKAVGGCTLLSCLALLAELYGVLNFLLTRQYFTEQDCNTIDRCMTIGAFLRCVLLVAGTGTGLVLSLTQGTFDSACALTAGEYLICAGLAAAVYVLQHRLTVRKFHNADGEVGSQY